MKLSDNEWAVLEVLWRGKRLALGDVVEQLSPVTGWSRNTVFTYLTRMEKKGLVSIDRTQPKPYAPAVRREACAREERQELLRRVYGGCAGELVAAFLKETAISPEERDRLKAMLDEMEV